MHHGGAAEFAGPDDEGFIEQATLFQIGQQGRYGLVGPAGAGFVVFDQVVVGIPTVFVGHVVYLDESDAALDQPPGQQAFAPKRLGAWVGVLEAVAPAEALGFAIGVSHFEGRRLHPVGQFVAGDARIKFGKSGPGVPMLQVQIADEVEGIALTVGKLGRRQQV